MTYRAIGVMSGSSLDGLDIAYVEFDETGGSWAFEIKFAECLAYDVDWRDRLQNAIQLNAYDYQLLHTGYGHYIGAQVNAFIGRHGLEHRVQLIASHGHTTFHAPHLQMTAQLGDGAAIAATTEINVVSDLRSMDVAFGGQGAPIVPIGEKLLLGEYDYFLNLGGIANVSFNRPGNYIAFDVCAANRVLNMLIQQQGQEFDEGGKMASRGAVDTALLEKLNKVEYYDQPFPKSLANDFGTGEAYPLVCSFNLPVADALRTYVEHIALQVGRAFALDSPVNIETKKLLITGGGAFNNFMVDRIWEVVSSFGIEVVVPESNLVNYKEAAIMALIGVLRWREEYNVIDTVTGARRSSIGGAVWIGQEA